MKQIRLSAAAVALAALFVVAVNAQAPAGRPATQPATQPAATRPAPAQPTGTTAAGSASGRIAVIHSGYFRGDEKGAGGIARYVEAARRLEAQFKPMIDEIQGLQTRYKTIVDNIQKTQAVARPEEIERQRVQAADLEVQIKRKGEDLERAVQARQEEVMGPIEQDVFNALQSFAQARGYSIVIDRARVPVLYAADSIDITREFIAEYNRTRPATASTATPAASRP